MMWPFRRRKTPGGSPRTGPIKAPHDGEGFLGNSPDARLFATVTHDNIVWTITAGLSKPRKDNDKLTIYLYKWEDGRRSFSWLATLEHFYDNPRYLNAYLDDVLVWVEGGPLPKGAKKVEREATSRTMTTMAWRYDG